MRLRRGITVLELLVVLGLAAILLATALPRVQAIADRASVTQGAEQVRTVLALARSRAVLLGTPVAVYVDSVAVGLVIGDAQGIHSRHAVGAASGATLTASRDSVAFSPLGLGWGATNVSLVVARGSAAETVTVSRMGRIK